MKITYREKVAESLVGKIFRGNDDYSRDIWFHPDNIIKVTKIDKELAYFKCIWNASGDSLGKTGSCMAGGLTNENYFIPISEAEYAKICKPKHEVGKLYRTGGFQDRLMVIKTFSGKFTMVDMDSFRCIGREFETLEEMDSVFNDDLEVK